MHRWLVLAGTMVLAGCAGAPRDLALAGLDLNDPTVVALASEGLPQKERAAFAVYALLHWPKSKAYCGRPMFSGSAQPATVGEAIASTMAFDAALARKRAAEGAAPSLFEQRSAQKKRLVDAFEDLTLQREMLASAPMSQAAREARMREIERELAENRVAREQLGDVPALFAGSAP